MSGYWTPERRREAERAGVDWRHQRAWAEYKQCFHCTFRDDRNLRLDCGHYICDDCLLSGEALDHQCKSSGKTI